MEWLEYLVREYGYLALFVGTFLEGETILLIAGFLASSGKLNLELCILAAFAGSLSGDQFAFYIGRYKGKAFIEKRRGWKDRVERVHKMLERFHEALILSFRFFYGVRNLTPFILGTTDISGLKFFALNSIGALVWAITFACAGYFFGTMVASVMKDVHNIELGLLGVILVVALLFWLHKIRKRRKEDARLEREATLSGQPTACGTEADKQVPPADTQSK